MLRQALAKLIMRAAGDQVNTAFGNLQLCAGLEAGIEGATHAKGKRKMERTKSSRERKSGDKAEEE